MHKKYLRRSQDLPKRRIIGVSLEHHFCWGKTILSPFRGKVLEVKDGWPERDPVHIVTDLWAIMKNAFFLKAKNPFISYGELPLIMTDRNSHIKLGAPYP